MGVDQLKALKRLQQENDRLRRAVSDLTLDKLILTASIMSKMSWAFPSVGRAKCSANIVRHSASCREGGLMKIAWSPT